jgi:hypothetical protein
MRQDRFKSKKTCIGWRDAHKIEDSGFLVDIKGILKGGMGC